MRIVSEWSDYDQEIKRIYNHFLEEKERIIVDTNQTTDRKHTGELFFTLHVIVTFFCRCFEKLDNAKYKNRKKKKRLLQGL